MEIIKIPYNEVPLLAERDVAYVEERPELKPFYKYPVRLEAFPDVIRDKQKDPVDRETLVRVLRSQHDGPDTHSAVKENIERLANDNTFTIVTAHQPSLFTGPLYYIFKIISVLNLTKKLNGQYPDYHFVPVFITSGEDHDFAEINHIHLFGKTLTWESGESGATGHMKTGSLQPVLEDLKEIMGNSDRASELFRLIEKTHTDRELYGDAAFALTSSLFKEDGLVVLNTNDARLKKRFIPIIKKEIFNQRSHELVQHTIEALSEAGYGSQATPREINFFYLKGNIRERIVEKNDGKYEVLNTDIVFDRQSLENEIDQHPEHFSPNVIMRPLYQELILPNLAYVGGGGELAYWLERKAQFEHFGLNFPMLIRRNSAMWIDGGTVRRMEKTGLQPDLIWEDTDSLIRHYLSENANTEFSLEKEREVLENIFNDIAGKTHAIDQSLEKWVLAEHAKFKKNFDQVETRLIRAEKQKHEKAISQIRTIKEKLFPENGLQERYDNFIAFYLKYGDGFFDVLKEHFDPLEKKFVIVVDR